MKPKQTKMKIILQKFINYMDISEYGTWTMLSELLAIPTSIHLMGISVFTVMMLLLVKVIHSCVVRVVAKKVSSSNNKDESEVPMSVNYHFTRKCNYECKFCFHQAKTSFHLPIDEAKRGIKMLKEAGMKKINFSGGEPFIVERGKYVGELVKYCKCDLKMESVTIVSNGSLIKEKWFQEYGQYLDIIAISCDSSEPETLKAIGRYAKRTEHIKQLRLIHDMCKKYEILFKINTVVCSANWHENLSEMIETLDPVRWKVFQCLLIKGENCGDIDPVKKMRDATDQVVSKEQFEHFLDTHKHIKCLVPESNEAMRNSYLILDEYMRFLNNTNGAKEPTKSILDVGVEAAMSNSGFDYVEFIKRGGKYKWSKKSTELEW